MPVIDHPIHPSTRIHSDHKPGCWNKPRPDPNGGYFAPQRRHFPDGSFEIISQFVPYRMSTECRFDQAMNPEHCEGCEHNGTGRAYAADQIARAKK